MAISIKKLGEGQLAAATAAMYTVPASTQAIIRRIVLVNTHNAAVTVNLFTDASGTDRRECPKDLSLEADGGTLTLGDIMTLEAGDKIEGDASVADKVDYQIDGVEQV